MAVTVTENASIIDAAEATGSYVLVGSASSLTANGDVFRKGSASISAKLNSGSGGILFNHGATQDYTGRHICIWVNTLHAIDSRANSGITVRVTGSATGDYGEWVVEGSEDGAGGWRLVVVDADRPFDATGGTPPAITAIQHVGVVFTVTTSFKGNIQSIFMDELKYVADGDAGITVSGGTSSDPGTWEEIATNDNTNAIGFVKQQGNTFFLNAPIEFGHFLNASHFEDVSEPVIIWSDFPVEEGAEPYYKLSSRAGAGTNVFKIGQRIGEGAEAIGSQGMFVNTNGPEWEFEFTNSGSGNWNDFALYGCSFSNSAEIKLGDGTNGIGNSGEVTSVELIDNNFLSPRVLTRDVQASGILYGRNKVSFSKDYRAGMDVADQAEIIATEWQMVQSPGFIESPPNASPVVFEATDHNFNQALVPYVNVTDDDETWDVINATWTVETTKQKQIDFTVPSGTDNGEITTDAANATDGAQRQCVRASNGDLYVAYENAGDLEIRKSSDDGATWGSILDDANSPACVRNPSIAINSSGWIHLLYANTTTVLQHETFDTNVDTYDVSTTTVHSAANSDVSKLDITIDSLDTAHAVYKTENNDDFHYNNSIDWSTNEVTLTTAGAAADGWCAIGVTSGNIPHCAAAVPTGAGLGSLRVYQGNARDATSFTENIINVTGDTDEPDVTDRGSMCITEDDVMCVTWIDINADLEFLYNADLSDFTVGAWTEAIVDDQEDLLTPTIAAINNRVFIIAIDSTDDELKYFESRNRGIGWSEITAITNATTSFSPTARWSQFNQNERWDLDIIYSDGASNPQHARIDLVPTAGTVNEKFDVNANVQQADGTKLENARVKIVESDDGAGSPALPNEASTDPNGDSSTTYLSREFTDDGADALSTVSHTGQALKVYKYDYLPFAGAITITSKQEPGVTLLTDSFTVDTEATAVLDGTQKVVINEAGANEHSIIKWTGGTGTLSIGDTITGDTSGATGVVVDIIEGNSTAGSAVLDTRNGNSYTAGGEGLTGSAGGPWTATFTASSETRYHWILEAGTISGTARTAQQLYDNVQAKLAQDPLDTTDFWDDMVIAGRSEFGSPVQGTSTSPNRFKTVRNVALTQGWCVAGLQNLGFIDSFESNDGTLFTPAASYNFTLTNIVSGSEVRICRSSDNVELDGTESSSTTFTYNHDGSAVDIHVIILHVDYEWLRIPDLQTGSITLGAADTSQTVQQRTDRNYSNP